jgi:hypothetical protein
MPTYSTDSFQPLWPDRRRIGIVTGLSLMGGRRQQVLLQSRRITRSPILALLADSLPEAMDQIRQPARNL